MKTSIFSALAAVALLASTTAFAAPAAPFGHDRDRDDHRPAQGPGNRYDDRNSRDFNYGYAPRHRVTPRERAYWEGAHRDQRPAVVVVVPQERARWEAQRRDNYGYDQNQRVSPQERNRWEAAHRYDDHR